LIGKPAAVTLLSRGCVAHFGNSSTVVQVCDARMLLPVPLLVTKNFLKYLISGI
jgi:hypothetical protein